MADMTKISMRPLLVDQDTAARVTGVSCSRQRHWRRSGALRCAKLRGIGYTAHHVAEMLVLRALGVRESPPCKAAIVARNAAPHIVRHALRAGERLVEVEGEASLARAYRASLRGEDSDSLDWLAGLDRARLRRYTVLSDTAYSQEDDLASSPEWTSAMVINHEAFGQELARSIDGPLFTVGVEFVSGSFPATLRPIRVSA